MENKILRHVLFAVLTVITTVFATILTIQMIVDRYIPISPFPFLSIEFYASILLDSSPDVSFRMFWGMIFWGLLFSAIFFPHFRKLLLSLFTPLKEFIRHLHTFFREYKAVVIASIAFFILCFGFEIANPTLTIDEELAFSGIEANPIPLWLVQGRLGISLFKAFFQYHNIFPLFVSSFIGTALWTLSCLAWCAVLFYDKESPKRTESIPLIIFCGLFMSMPTIIPTFMIFGTFNIEVGIAMLFSALSVYCIMRYNARKERNSFIAALFPLTFAISVYQSFISVFITGAVAALFVAILQSPGLAKKDNLDIAPTSADFFTWLRSISPNIVALLISIAAYYAFLYVSFAVTGLQASSYVNALVGWGHGTPISVLLSRIVNQTYTLLLAPGAIGALGVRLTVIALILTSALGVICYKGWRRFLIPVLCVLLGLSPFSLIFALMGFLPLRTMQAVPLMMGVAWCIMFIVIRQLTKKRTAIIIPYIIAALLIFGQIQTLNRLYYGDYVRHQMDRRLAAMIMYDVKLKFGQIPDAPFLFFGTHAHPPNPAVVWMEVVSGSFWNWGGETHIRALAFLQSEGYNIMPITDNTNEIEARYREQMPIWPLNGSIIETEYGILVRLS